MIAAWRPGFVVAVVGSAAIGLSVPSAGADAELALLLRFMAVVKAGMALGVAALIVWRMAVPIRTGMAAGYGAGVCAMALGSALIWQLAYVGLGAALVHIGLLAVLVVGWRDREGFEKAWTAGRQRRVPLPSKSSSVTGQTAGSGKVWSIVSGRADNASA